MKQLILLSCILLFTSHCIQNLGKCPQDTLSLKTECQEDVDKEKQEELFTMAILATAANQGGNSTYTSPSDVSTDPTTGEYSVVSGATSAHNSYRKAEGVGLPDMTWDATVAAYSKSKAEYLANSGGCKLDHNIGPTKPSNYGENLYWSSRSTVEAATAIKAWYDEKQYYTYATNSCSNVCGHYTQVVWKDSTKLGCYAATCPNNGGVIFACNYTPAGNYVGQKPY